MIEYRNMKKGRVTLLLVFVLLVVAGAGYTLNHLYKKEQAPEARFGVEAPRIADIIKKSVSFGYHRAAQGNPHQAADQRHRR